MIFLYVFDTFVFCKNLTFGVLSDIRQYGVCKCDLYYSFTNHVLWNILVRRCIGNGLQPDK